jgi:hypothetical protein
MRMRRRAAPPAQQHVDDRIDQVGIDRQQAVIVQLLGPEHRQDRRQRDGVQIVAEPDRRDVVEADLDVVGGEVAQRGRHQPDQPVKDDLQHRQPLVGDQRGIDDGADAGAAGLVVAGQVEAEQAVDLILVQDALAGRRKGVLVNAAGVTMGRCRQAGLGQILGVVGHWISISSISTASTLRVPPPD